MRERSRIKSVTPNLFNTGTKAFTLIELLVVVLIIGILVAVALPQYQKAVEKSKATQAITMLKSLGQAQMAYHLANGTSAEKFEELDIDVPLAEDPSSAFSENITDTRANQDWSFQLNPSFNLVAAKRLSGKYQGNGFFFYTRGQVLEGKLRCIENTGNAGQYCVKLFGATLSYQEGSLREYDMN